MSSQPKKMNWPLPVREYVQRSFAAEDSFHAVTRAEIESILKRIITEAAEQELIDIVDWKTLPPPKVFIQQENQYQMRKLESGQKGQYNVSANTRSSDLFNLHLYAKPKNDESVNLCTTSDQVFISWLNTRTDVTIATHKNKDIVERFSITDKIDPSLRRDGEQNSLLLGIRSCKPMLNTSSELRQKSNFGTNKYLEKNYYRLTSAPKPETIRPLHVLQDALELLKKKWRAENNYSYICDQLKSIRQDLTVQHIETDFTVSVYEIHARIALENGDLGEYNQCQTVLERLYKQSLCGHPAEFIAYRILYFIYTRNRTQMNHVLTGLTESEKMETAINHALSVRSALALGNYHRFFRLYLYAPNMGAYLMDMFIERERESALKVMCKA